MSATKTIVFGPTGAVGSAAALSAQKHGAKVFLAMRDTQKAISGLSSQEEEKLGFERVQADLTQPETIHAAVSETGAKHAFIYLAHTPDGMKPVLASLKSAGIEFVVFLSAWNVDGDVRKIPPEDYIPWSHAQVEINLEEIFGANRFIAVRPWYFASNVQWWSKMVPTGEVKILYPDIKFDFISPTDIGSVSGVLLARGWQQGDQHVLWLCGPENLSGRDAAKMIGKAVGKDLTITAWDEKEAYDFWRKERAAPEPVIKYLVRALGEESRSTRDLQSRKEEKGAVNNIEKYTGRPPMRFSEWVDRNKRLFSGS